MIKIVHRLRLASGTNAKLKILKQEAGNDTWLNVLRFMYDTSKNYYMSAPSDFTFIEKSDLDYNKMFLQLTLFETGNYRGNRGKDMALKLSREFGEILRLILTGSLKAGVSTTTINKAYPGLIPTFPLMLAENVKVPQLPVYASTKFDGVRLTTRVQDGIVSPRTRSGKFLDLQSLISSMKSLPNGVYDGELVHGSGRQASRTKITGSVNRILSGHMDDIEDYTYQIFDLLTLAEWDSRTCDRPLLTRLRELYDIDMSNEYIRSIQQKELLTAEDIEILFKHHIDRGFEGLILRYMEHPYEWRRTANLIKKKAVLGCVLKCVGVIEGKGKYAGMIGALVCEGYISNKFINVNVGTGLNDFDRDMGEGYFINSDVEVDYNDIVIADGSSVYSLFLPVFKRVVGGV